MRQNRPLTVLQRMAGTATVVGFQGLQPLLTTPAHELPGGKHDPVYAPGYAFHEKHPTKSGPGFTMVDVALWDLWEGGRYRDSILRLFAGLSYRDKVERIKEKYNAALARAGQNIYNEPSLTFDNGAEPVFGYWGSVHPSLGHLDPAPLAAAPHAPFQIPEGSSSSDESSSDDDPDPEVQVTKEVKGRRHNAMELEEEEEEWKDSEEDTPAEGASAGDSDDEDSDDD